MLKFNLFKFDSWQDMIDSLHPLTGAVDPVAAAAYSKETRV